VHGTAWNQRYVDLEQINSQTIFKLGAVWISQPFEDGEVSRMTPLVHDGMMFLGAGARIYALDARTGKAVWMHRTDEIAGRPERSGRTGDDRQDTEVGLAVSRSWGVSLGGGMIFAGLMNGHVIALSEKTGRLIWDRRFSRVPIAQFTGIKCVPLYSRGVLYFGFGHEFFRGYAVAVDAKTGEELWRVPMVPDPDQPGHETWPQDNEIWRSGDSQPWAAAASDAALGVVYFVTANPGPPSGGKIRRGDNLYSVSIIALDMKAGSVRWYRQLVHHDLWEADLSVPPVLFDTRIHGQLRRGIAVMRGDGYLFEVDRARGEPLLPIDERAVPQNAELFTSLTQPFPRDGESILPPCESWRPKVPLGFVLGCMFDPPSSTVPNRLMQFARVRIAPMAYSAKTGYFYAQGANSLMWQGSAEDPYVWMTNVNGARIPNFPAITATVAAIDGRTGKVIWTKELPSYNDSGINSNGGRSARPVDLSFIKGETAPCRRTMPGPGRHCGGFRLILPSAMPPQ